MTECGTSKPDQDPSRPHLKCHVASGDDTQHNQRYFDINDYKIKTPAQVSVDKSFIAQEWCADNAINNGDHSKSGYHC